MPAEALRGWGWLAVGVLLVALLPARSARAQPTFTSTFAPSTIGPGSTTTLRYVLDNPAGAPLEDVAFSHTLPAGVVVADPPVAGTDCVSGSVQASAGGGLVALSGARLGTPVTCSVWVDVTSSTPGAHDSLTDALSWRGGTGDTAAATLTVDTNRPGFRADVDPAVVGLGGVSTVTLTIDNSLNASGLASLSVTGSLPEGVRVAAPAQATTTCGNDLLPPSYAPVAGGDSISFFANGLLPTYPTVPAGATCTITFDVEAQLAGTFPIRMDELLVGNVSVGRAGAALEAEIDELHKVFVDDPTAPGGTVEVVYRLTNFNRVQTVDSIQFTDDFSAALTGLVRVGPLPSEPCGPGSSVTGEDVLTFAGGALAPEESCEFSVSLAVPAGAATGDYVSTTSDVSFQSGGTARSWPAASDTLRVSPRPRFEKAFLASPAAPGGSVELRYTIENVSDTASLADLTFTDNLTDVLVGLTAPGLPASDVCGAGSTLNYVPLDTDVFGLRLTDGNLGPSESCTFDVTLQLPPGAQDGPLPSASSYLEGVLGATPVLAPPALATLTVAATPRLTKSFESGAVLPGGSTLVHYTLSLDETAAAEVTDITFSDDLGSVAEGLRFAGLPSSDVCGAGSELTASPDASTVTLTGAALQPGESCELGVELQADASTAVGSYESVTTEVLATSQGLSVVAPAARAALQVLGLTLDLALVSGTAYPGGEASLEVTLANTSASVDASAIAFSLDLDEALSGLNAGSLPTAPCGPASSLSGTTSVSLSGGALASGESCVFTIPLEIPNVVASDAYPLTTTEVTALWDGAGTVFPAATASLLVGDPLMLSKEFTNAPAALGGSVTLRFTLANADPDRAATQLGFTDDLDAVLPGLVATGLPRSDVCGAGSTLTGTDVIDLAGGSVPAAGACAFDVEVRVPADATFVPGLENVTSTLTGQLGGATVWAPPAVAPLDVVFATVGASFEGATGPGGRTTLRLSLDNLDTISAMSSLSLRLDLDAMLSGATALDLPQEDVCGDGSSLVGDAEVSLRGGHLEAGSSCSMELTVQVPEGATTGAYPLQTSALSDGAASVASGASTRLTVEEATAFTLTPLPASPTVGETSNLRYTLDQSALVGDAQGLAFEQALPEGLVVAASPQASTDCAGGVLDATGGADRFSLSQASLAGGESCSVSVHVTSAEAADYALASSALRSSHGVSAPATASLGFVAEDPTTDAGADGGSTGTDGGASDGGGVDGGGVDGGVTDGGGVDAGMPPEAEGGVADGSSDAPGDAGNTDAAASGGGCSCRAAGQDAPVTHGAWLLLGLYLASRARRRRV